MTHMQSGGLVRPEVTEHDAVQIAKQCYGLTVTARELGSNQDRNFLLETAAGEKSVLRIDNPVFNDDVRNGQHAALDAYAAAGVPAPAVLPGLDGELIQRWNTFAVRRSEFAEGETLVDAGYFAPCVLEEFGALAAASVAALSTVQHPGLEREHMWDMRVAAHETTKLLAAISDDTLRARVENAARAAEQALNAVAAALPVQVIHGDLTDDNVMGTRGDDTRLHPRTVLDLGDISTGWRVAEIAVTAASLLHHEPERPLRVLHAVSAFHAREPLSAAEARALWPLIVLRASLMVASGWQQLRIDGDNDYARERIAGEQAIFDAATAVPLAEATEQVLAATGFTGIADGEGLRELAVPAALAGAPLSAILPDFSGDVAVLDLGVESELLGAGRWTAADAETTLRAAEFAAGAAAVLVPYGVYRLTRTLVDSADAGETWPIASEVWLPAGAERAVTAPVDAEIVAVREQSVLLNLRNGWTLIIDGVQPAAACSAGDTVHAGQTIAVLDSAETERPLSFTLCRADAQSLSAVTVAATGEASCVAPERVAAWSRFTADPAVYLGLESFAQRDEADDEQARREQIFASAQERYYERPMQIERGWRHHLIDTTGRAYIDVVNNVTGLGHGHPGVADAVNRQIRILNTNSRFLYRELAEYSERLLALLPEESELDTVLLVNSGSEAVDLALRLAQAATGRKTVVALREAYHGWTMASDAVTTSAYDNPYAVATRPDWVHVADVPNMFRGTYRGADSGAAYVADVAASVGELATQGRDVAAFICESVLGNAGGVLLPDGYLRGVYDTVRAAGGLCIADEVQVGFGRMGSTFWGFEQSGVMPDIITIAKPMGNGFPIGGVITTKKIADALATQGQFFSSAGGNPLSCRVGLAVLDAMEAEGLQENSRVVGRELADGFRALAQKHAMIGPVHGEGLYLGVELVRDRETLEPAKQEAAAICERLRELGVVVLTTSERSNVLKVKPPLCLTSQSAQMIVAALDRVLTEGW